ncbi:hypothetical protein [Spongiimicrobium sp. 3-5]|uniref:hypothetical protein n=1 Tax=Spongiimicrobium sp. 3-5 TaxID=3332596 RepID=UPI00397F13D2
MLTEIINGLIKLLGPIATLSKDKRELKDSALRAISNALDETFLYYRDINNGKARNLEREALLVKYWSAASIPIRHLDEELSIICNQKAEYWLNPEEYNREDIAELGIGLDSVRDAYRKILDPYYSTFKTRKKN